MSFDRLSPGDLVVVDPHRRYTHVAAYPDLSLAVADAGRGTCAVLRDTQVYMVLATVCPDCVLVIGPEAQGWVRAHHLARA